MNFLHPVEAFSNTSFLTGYQNVWYLMALSRACFEEQICRSTPRFSKTRKG